MEVIILRIMTGDKSESIKDMSPDTLNNNNEIHYIQSFNNIAFNKLYKDFKDIYRSVSESDEYIGYNLPDKKHLEKKSLEYQFIDLILSMLDREDKIINSMVEISKDSPWYLKRICNLEYEREPLTNVVDGIAIKHYV